MGNLGVPRKPASYALAYDYSGSQASFSVVLPHLDAAASVRSLAGSYTDPTTGNAVQTQGYAHAFSLRWNGQSYICVTVWPVARAQVVSADPNGSFSGINGLVFKRIATSQNPVVSISVVADSSGNPTITWQDSTGAMFTANFTTVYPLQIFRNPAGAGWVEPIGTRHYSPGATANLTAIPNPGYSFLNWTGDAVANPTSATTTITMSNEFSVTANFVLTSPMPIPANVSSQVQVTTSNPSFSSGHIVENMTITNTSGQYIAGPISVALTSLSTGFTLANATGTYNGSPYIQILPYGLLAPGQSYTTFLQFSVGPAAIVRFTPLTYSGL